MSCRSSVLGSVAVTTPPLPSSMLGAVAVFSCYRPGSLWSVLGHRRSSMSWSLNTGALFLPVRYAIGSRFGKRHIRLLLPAPWGSVVHCR